MKIKKAELKYFKFHQNLAVDFDNKNMLIYGENGTGKSSIYEALYSNFYHQKRLDKNIAQNIQETYRNRKFPTEDLEVNIEFNSGQTLNRSENNLYSNDTLNNTTIYFANEKILNRLTKENFYIALKDTLIEHFPKLKELIDLYSDFDNIETVKRKIIEEIKSEDPSEILDTFNKKIAYANSNFETKFKEIFIDDEINKIINEHFDEKFKISFSITPAKSGDSDILEFNPPFIKIKIDEIECDGKLSHHFNEAKLKLIGVAIYFALAKKYEAQENGFKLLVLDDFLTSLDMANRKLIVKYILEEFKDYQKLILTHNLQFFNVAKKLINKQYNTGEWKMQFLFITQEENGFIAYLKDKSNDYLSEAEKYLKAGEYQISGNFLRKEFESLSEELRQILELGDTESLNRIIELIKKYDSKEYYYFEPLTVIDFVMEKITHLKNKLQGITNDKVQVNIFNEKLNEISTHFINHNEKDKIEALVSIIKKIDFYRDITFNATSHTEKEIEIYRTECKQGIGLLKELRTIHSKIKKEKVK